MSRPANDDDDDDYDDDDDDDTVILAGDTDICDLLETLRQSNVDMLGESLDVTAKRRTAWASLCSSPTDDCDTQPQQPPSSLSASLLNHQKCSQLLALRRTLKVMVSIHPCLLLKY